MYRRYGFSGILAGFIVFLFTLSATTTDKNNEISGNEKIFWEAYLNGNLNEAARKGEEIGDTLKEYYFLSGICYQHTFNYLKSNILQNKYLNSKNEYQKLIELLDRVENNNPKNPYIYLMKGWCSQFNTEMNLKEPIKYFRKALVLDEDNKFALNYVALNLILKDSLSKGLLKAEEAIRIDSTYPEPYNNLSFIYTRWKKRRAAFKELLDCLSKCHRVPSNTYESLINIISSGSKILLSPNGNKFMTPVPEISDSSIRDTIIEVIKKSPHKLLNLAENFLKYNSIKEVSFLLKDFECPESLEYKYNYIRAMSVYLSGSNDLFYKYVEEFMENGGTDDYRRTFDIGNVLYSTGDYNMAIGILKKGLESVYPRDESYIIKYNSNIGSCYLKKEDYEEAEKWLNKALKMNPDDYTTLLNMGIYYLNLQEKEKAKEMFERARKNTVNNDNHEKIDDWLEKVGE